MDYYKKHMIETKTTTIKTDSKSMIQQKIKKNFY